MTDIEFIKHIVRSDYNNYDHKGQMYGPYLNYKPIECAEYGYMKDAKRHGRFVCTYTLRDYNMGAGMYEHGNRVGIWNFYDSYSNKLIIQKLYIS